MRHIGLKFVFKSGAWFQALLTETEAQRIISAWRLGKSQEKEGGVSPDGSWAVAMADVAFLHTVDPAPSPWRGSGLN